MGARRERVRLNESGEHENEERYLCLYHIIIDDDYIISRNGVGGKVHRFRTSCYADAHKHDR